MGLAIAAAALITTFKCGLIPSHPLSDDSPGLLWGTVGDSSFFRSVCQGFSRAVDCASKSEYLNQFAFHHNGI